MKILLVGAGLFNSVLYNELHSYHNIKVIEKRDHIGGNCYTEKIDGITIHKYGAHIFHTDDEYIWDYVNRFVTFNNFINSPIALSYNKEKQKYDAYNLPFNMNTFSEIYGYHTIDEMKEIIENDRTKFENPKNLEEQATNLVGNKIYQKLIKEYTEKQWGNNCSELSPTIIKRIPLRFSYDNNYFSDRYQGIADYSKMIANLFMGSSIEYGVDFLEEKDTFLKYDLVIYNGSIDEYFDYKMGFLPFRSLSFDTVRYEVSNYQGNAVVNYTTNEVPYTRKIEHKFFNNECFDKNFTYVTTETPEIYDGHNEQYYPVVNKESTILYEKMKSKLPKNVILGGRLGLFKYNDMDDTIKLAIQLAKTIRK